MVCCAVHFSVLSHSCLIQSQWTHRVVNIYTKDSNFVVKAASAFLNAANDQPACASSSAVLACSGRSTPGPGHIPYFYVTCGDHHNNVSTYLGSDPYHFAPYFGGTFPGHGSRRRPVRSYSCTGKEASARPRWKLMGYFDPADAACASMATELTYDELTCDSPSVGVAITADEQHANGRAVGTYFTFELSDWSLVFGDTLTKGTRYDGVELWRNGHIVWTGDARVWPRGSADNGDWARGRAEPLTSGHFQTGDQLSPRPLRVLVTSVDWRHANSRPAGSYFSFELSQWSQVFGDVLTKGTLYNGVELWRDGHILWTGDIKVWPWGSANSSGWPRGRAESLIPVHFQTGDQLSPRPLRKRTRTHHAAYRLACKQKDRRRDKKAASQSSKRTNIRWGCG